MSERYFSDVTIIELLKLKFRKLAKELETEFLSVIDRQTDSAKNRHDYLKMNCLAKCPRQRCYPLGVWVYSWSESVV
jgi:hypothetical protein